ncbi:MAG TPA: tetraacyldisaccharide 4'-kinase [Geobacteraceae bacterium]
MAELSHYFRALWDGRRNTATDRLFLSLLTPLSLSYAAALKLRAGAYRAGIFRSYRLPRPVVAVGNLTVGGTGKTPMTAYLARWFMERGKRVAILSRGYGGSLEGETRIVSDGRAILLTPDEAGDEPYLLASSLPGVMAVIGPDRYRAGCLALEQLEPDIFILDDGFQHLRLERDLNILLLDCGRPFGNGRTVPAGELREPVAAAGRADLIIFTRCSGEGPSLSPDKPWCATFHRLTGAVSVAGGETRPFAEMEGLKGLAFAGIAEPAYFFASLAREGLRLVTSRAFPDHCRYGEEEIAILCRLREECRADYLITTQKDAVKLTPHLEKLGPVYAAGLELELADAGPLTSALEKLL